MFMRTLDSTGILIKQWVFVAKLWHASHADRKLQPEPSRLFVFTWQLVMLAGKSSMLSTWMITCASSLIRPEHDDRGRIFISNTNDGLILTRNCRAVTMLTPLTWWHSSHQWDSDWKEYEDQTGGEFSTFFIWFFWFFYFILGIEVTWWHDIMLYEEANDTDGWLMALIKLTQQQIRVFNSCWIYPFVLCTIVLHCVL